MQYFKVLPVKNDSLVETPKATKVVQSDSKVLTPKKTINKFFTIGTLFVFSLVLIFLSSNTLISGRRQTQGDIQRKGIISGIYSSRLRILNNYFNESKIHKIIFGTPGLGTNTACNTVTGKAISEECQNSDSLFGASLFSFGVIGVLLYIVNLIVVSYNSYSPLMPIAFLVFSLSQVFPELILPWTQFVLLLFHSNQIKKIPRLNIQNNE